MSEAASQSNVAVPSSSLPASHVFADSVNNIVSKREIDSCLNLQHEIHKKTKDSHQALSSFNVFSAKEFAKMAPELERKTKQIQMLKKDLYNIFDRISELRESIGYRFPDQEVILPEELENGEENDFWPETPTGNDDVTQKLENTSTEPEEEEIAKSKSKETETETEISEIVDNTAVAVPLSTDKIENEESNVEQVINDEKISEPQILEDKLEAETEENKLSLPLSISASVDPPSSNTDDIEPTEVKTDNNTNEETTNE